MKFPFLAKHNVLNIAVTIGVLMATSAVGNVIAKDADSAPEKGSRTFIMTDDEMMHWIANTDAKLTFIGDSVNPLTSRSAQITTVTYCNNRSGNVCGGDCTVYTGSATCLHAPDTQCLAATNNVGFCDKGKCRGSCHDLAGCGVHLDNNFCFTPGTASIAVSSA